MNIGSVLSQLLIFLYLAVCVSIIVFNSATMVHQRVLDWRRGRMAKRLIALIRREMLYVDQTDRVRESHLRMLGKKLQKVENLIAFDMALEGLSAEDAERAKRYLHAIYPCFLHLVHGYIQRDDSETTYFVYIVRKFHLIRHGSFDPFVDAMMPLLLTHNLYCRENMLHMLYQTGEPEAVVRALRMMDGAHCYHNPKLIHDGLLTYTGDKTELAERLWTRFDRFSDSMQTALLNFMRLAGVDCRERVAALLAVPDQDDEVAFAAVRYFGRFPYLAVYPRLLGYLKDDRGERWTYAAVAAGVLRSYPSEQTAKELKAVLSSPNWYVRKNAAESLVAMGKDESDLLPILEGADPYAREMLQYWLDYKHMEREEGNKVP